MSYVSTPLPALYFTTGLNECEPNPCQNGGTCVDGVQNYTCNCASLPETLTYYTGRNCSIGEMDTVKSHLSYDLYISGELILNKYVAETRTTDCRSFWPLTSAYKFKDASV